MTPDTEDRLGDAFVIEENHNFLRFLREFVAMKDKSESWREDGAHGMAGWLSFKYSYPYSYSTQVVQTARVIDSLPAIAAAFADGMLSRFQLLDLCAFVTPEQDDHYAQAAIGATADTVKRWARRARVRRREEAAINDGERSLELTWDKSREMLRMSGFFPGDTGALIKKTLDNIANREGRNADGTWNERPQRLADALVEVVGSHAGARTDTERANVVVHVDYKELLELDGTAHIEHGPFVTSEVARRLLCDGRIQFALHDDSGAPLGIGTRSRVVPAWEYKLLIERDKVCVTCGADCGLQAHHWKVHVAYGGRTDLDDLVLVCRRCHVLVHDHGFTIRLNKQGIFELVRPNGTVVKRGPEKLSPEARARLLGQPWPPDPPLTPD